MELHPLSHFTCKMLHTAWSYLGDLEAICTMTRVTVQPPFLYIVLCTPQWAVGLYVRTATDAKHGREGG